MEEKPGYKYSTINEARLTSYPKNIGYYEIPYMRMKFYRPEAPTKWNAFWLKFFFGVKWNLED